MTSYKTFLNAVRAAISSAVNKVSQRLARFEEAATEKYNELAFAPIYETPIKDVWSGEITRVYTEIESGFPALVAGKEYIVTIGDVEYRATATIVPENGGTAIYNDDFAILFVQGAAVIYVSSSLKGQTMTIQKIGDPVEVGKEWLHDYVDGKVDTAQTTADSAATAASKAQTTADSAATAASKAQTTADSAATAASKAQTTADSAATAASKAQTTADSAATAASKAQTTADSAATAASKAQTTADSAATAASKAQTTAETAQTTAETAQTTAETKVGFETGEGYYITVAESPKHEVSKRQKILGVLCACATQLPNFAFSGCSNLKFVGIPCVMRIGQYAFYNCTSLTSITIPVGLISAGSGAFQGCSNLTSVAFGENSQLTRIAADMFRDCTSLTSITIPNSITGIGDRAFQDCTALTSITYTGTVEQWNAIILYDNWNIFVPATEVVCSDGTVSLTGEETT